MARRARRSASAFSAMEMNSLPRWLISMTDMPLPCQSSISAAAFRNTGSGRAAGPGLKLKTLIEERLTCWLLGNKRGAARRPGSNDRSPLLGLGHRPQIRLVRLVTLWILLLCFVVGNRRWDDHVLARSPVDRSRNGELRIELHRIEQAQHLIEVAPRAHRVGERRLDLLVGANDEHRTHRGVVHCGPRAGTRVGMDHVVRLGDLEIGVADQRVIDLGPLSLLDVLDPSAMVADRIDA